ncbi:MAG: hypothetical protein OSJ68_05090, partial [Clostridia bacterium]|nr:hypothetical protein [Clostridia bacterium]
TLLLQEKGARVAKNRGAAVLVDKKLDKLSRVNVMKNCAELRRDYNVTVLNKIKNFGYQLKQLKEQGYEVIYEYKNGAFNKID